MQYSTGPPLGSQPMTYDITLDSLNAKSQFVFEKMWKRNIHDEGAIAAVVVHPLHTDYSQSRKKEYLHVRNLWVNDNVRFTAKEYKQIAEYMKTVPTFGIVASLNQLSWSAIQ